jgi:uncharacterized repeat protein (TIGR01451 family)
MKFRNVFISKLFLLFFLLFSSSIYAIDFDNDSMDDSWEILYGLDNTSALDASLDLDTDGLINLWEYLLGFNPTLDNSDSIITISNESLNGIDDPFEDLDLDSLTNDEEINVYFTNPLTNDTDVDNLSDYDEVITYFTNASYFDTDYDLISDYHELFTYFTNATDSDTDSDSLSDYDELFVYLTNVSYFDTDYDNLSDYDELIVYFTSPFLNDTDSDNLSDFDEATLYFSSGNASDSDSDNLSDYNEVITYFTNASYFDSDYDLISDYHELFTTFTDPLNNDTDSDNLSDYDELFVYSTNPFLIDTENDSLSDYSEVIIYLTSPFLNDTDSDNLSDYDEVITYFTNASYFDTDSDNLSDYDELFTYFTNPLNNDTDVDNLSDYDEMFTYFTNPLNNDSDSDNLSDYSELIIYSTSPFLNDTDSDNLSDYNEVITYFTNASYFDSDYDLISDYQELFTTFTDPLNNDTDVDNLSDYDELFVYHSSPFIIDTDLDGIDDGAEVVAGSDPIVGFVGTQDRYFLNFGDEVEYFFNLTLGYETYNSVLKNVLPDNLIYADSSNNASVFPSINGNEISWDLGNISIDTTFAFSIKGYLLDNLSLNLLSQIDENMLIYDYENILGGFHTDSYLFNKINVTEPILSMSYFANVSEVAVGEDIFYSINITNLGTEVYNLQLSDLLPEGIDFISSNPAPSSVNSSNITFYFTNLSSSLSIGIVGRVNVTYPSLEDVLIRDLLASEVELFAYSNLNTTIAREYDLFNQTNVMVKNAGIVLDNNVSTVSIGDYFEAQIIMNFSNAGANNVRLYNYLPFGSEYVNYSSSIPSIINQTGDVVEFDFSNVSLGVYFLNVTYFANNSINDGDILTNNLSFYYQNSTAYVYLLNTQDLVSVLEPDLLITNNAFSPVSVGDLLTYIVDVSNVGNGTAYSPLVLNELEDGVEFVSSLPFSPDNLSGVYNETLSFNLPDLDVLDIYQINITVNITDKYHSGLGVLSNDSFTNKVNVSYFSTSNINLSRGYFNYTNSTSLIKDGAIAKDTSGIINLNSTSAIRVSENFNYNILVNFTGAPANTVLVEDLLPAGIVFVNETNSYNSSALNINGSLLTWNFGNLNGSDPLITINLTVFVNESSSYFSSNTFVNTANLTYSNSYGSSILRQDSATVYVVEPNPVISNMLINISGTPQYHIYLENINYSDSFEVDLGGWSQSALDDRDWTIDASGTPSSTTGPSSASDGSNYIYTETSDPVLNGDVFILEKAVNLTESVIAQIRFDYHMYFSGSSSGGTLELYVNNGVDNLVWNLSGDQGDLWYEDELVDISSYSGQEVTLKFKFTVGTNENYYNDCALDDILVVKKRNVTVNSIIEVGDLINYNLNISNPARSGNIYNSELYNITLIDLIPNGFLFNSSTLLPDFVNSTHLIWNLGDLAVDNNLEINLTYELNSTYIGTDLVLAEDLFTNNILVEGYSFLNESLARVYNLNSSSLDIIVKSPLINSSSSVLNVTVGDFFNYSLNFNLSYAPSNSVVLENILPFGLEFVNSSSSHANVFDSSGNSLKFDFGNLTEGFYIVDLLVFVNDSISNGEMLNNIVYLNYSSNNESVFRISSSSFVEVLEPDLLIVNNGFSPVSVGDLLTYIVDISNVGSGTAYLPLVLNELSNGVDFISSSPMPDNLSGVYNETLSFNLPDLNVLDSYQINITVNITDNYRSGFLILANDSLTNKVNVSYYSTSNTSLAREYINATNSTSLIKDGAIIKDTQGTIDIGATHAVRLGENFVYELIVNFTGAPANSVLVQDLLPTDLVFVNETNSYNSSAFNITGNLLTWNFGNLSSAKTVIYINFTAYINSSSLLLSSNSTVNSADLIYYNSYGSSILKQDSASIFVVEPNIKITNTLLSSGSKDIGDLIDYRINFTNYARLGNNYNSELYDSFLEIPITNGLVYNSSSKLPFLVNLTHIVLDLGNFSINETKEVNVSFNVNQSYRTNDLVFSDDLFYLDSQIQGYSNYNISSARVYVENFTSSSFDINSPELYLSQNLSGLSIGDSQRYEIVLNFSNAPVKSALVKNTIPNGTNFFNFTSNVSVSFSQIGNDLFFDFGNVSQGIYGLSLIVYVNASLNAGDLMENKVNFSYLSSVNTVYSLNDSIFSNIVEPFISFSIDSNPFIFVNELLIYSLNITNFGNSTAYHVELVDIIPEGFEFVSSSIIPSLITGIYNETLIYNLSQILAGENIILNITLNVTDDYFNDELIFADDIFNNFGNLTYFSSINQSLAIEYQVLANYSNTVSKPELLVLSLPSNVIVGELLNYSILLNFTNAPVKDALIRTKLNSELSLYSFNSSYSGVGFSLDNDTLYWNYSMMLINYSSLINLNLSVYLKNVTNLSLGDLFSNTFVFEYSNSNLDKFNLSELESFVVNSPNLEVHMSQNKSFVEVYDYIRYDINVSNFDVIGNYTSKAYDVSLIDYLPKEIQFVNSTILRDDSNTENLSFYLGDMDVGDIITFSIEGYVKEIENVTLDNFSHATSLVNVAGFSLKNSSYKKEYLNSTFIHTVRYDVTSPVIYSAYVKPKGIATGENVSLFLDAFDVIEIDKCYTNITLPNLSVSQVFDVCEEKQYSVPLINGNFSVEFFVNDTSSNIASLGGFTFEAKDPISFEIELVDKNITDTNTSIEIYYEDDLISISVGSNMSTVLSNFSYDILFKSYEQSLVVKLDSVVISENLNQSIGFDKILTNPDSLVVYGVENDNYSFSNAQVEISYNGLSYSDEDNLYVQVCEDWVYFNASCNSTWNNLSAQQDSVNNLFKFNRSSFSAFAINEVIVSGSSGGDSEDVSDTSDSSSGSSSGGSDSPVDEQEYIPVTVDDSNYNVLVECVENWVCSDWSVCDSNDSQFRVCSDVNICNSFTDKPLVLQDCVSERKWDGVLNFGSKIYNNDGVVNVINFTKRIFNFVWMQLLWIGMLINVSFLILIVYLRYAIIKNFDKSPIRVQGFSLDYYKNNGKVKSARASFRFYTLIGISVFVPVFAYFLNFLNIGLIIGVTSEFILLIMLKIEYFMKFSK